MKLENQVCNLELSKRLKERGVKQESYFVWFDMDGEWEIVEKLPAMPPQKQNGGANEWYAAFTTGELGEMLPAGTICRKGVKGWSCYFHTYGIRPEHATTEADARAKMLIYLLENGLIKL